MHDCPEKKKHQKKGIEILLDLFFV